MKNMTEYQDERQCFEDVLPRITIAETDAVAVLKAEMPGLIKENINVDVNDGVLSIRGKRADSALPKEYTALYQERPACSYARNIAIGNLIETDRITAVYEQGILTLTMPKTEKVLPKKIAVL